MTHHHHPGHRHPVQGARSLSLLRMSAAERLALAVAAVALLWVAILWAMA